MRWELGEDGRYHKGNQTLGPRAMADRLTKLERDREGTTTALDSAQRIVGMLASGRQPTPQQVAVALQWLKNIENLQSEVGRG